MKVIHKFQLANDGASTKLRLKHGYKIIHSEYILVEKSICLWVEQTLSVEVPEIEVVFKVAKSGEPLADHLLHIASVVDNFAPEAYHIFQESGREIRAAKVDMPSRQSSAA